MFRNRLEKQDDFSETEYSDNRKFNLAFLKKNGRYVLALGLVIVGGAKIAESTHRTNYINKPSNITDYNLSPEPSVLPNSTPSPEITATPSPEPTPTPSPEPTSEPQLAHNLEIGIQEESIGWDPALADLVLTKGKEMGATVFRTIVYPNELSAPDSVARVDLKVNKAQQFGYKVHITLSSMKTDWTDETFSNYVASVVNRYPGVARFSIFNEPNQGTLRTMPGKTQGETARELYEVGEKTIHSIRPNAEVIAFDLGSKNYPLVYLREALDACPDFRNNNFFKSRFPNIYNDAPTCPPLKAYRVGYHPYLFTTPPNSKTNLPGPDSEQVGINALDLVVKEIDEAHAQGQIETPGGNSPNLDINEHAYLSQESDGNLADRGLPEEERRVYYLQSLNIACKNERVRRFSPYGFVVQSDSWPGHWESPLLDRQRNPLPSYLAIQEWAHRSHENCNVEK